MKVERIHGRPRYWFLYRADTKAVCAVYDKVGITTARFFGAPPQIGEIYKCRRMIPHEDRPEQLINARVLRPVPVETVQAMLKASGSRRRVTGNWYEVHID